MTSITSSSMRSSIGQGGASRWIARSARRYVTVRVLCTATWPIPDQRPPGLGFEGLVQRGGGPTRGQPCEGLVDEASEITLRGRSQTPVQELLHTGQLLPCLQQNGGPVHGSIEAVCLLDPVVHAQEGLAWMKAIGVDGWRP